MQQASRQAKRTPAAIPIILILYLRFRASRSKAWNPFQIRKDIGKAPIMPSSI